MSSHTDYTLDIELSNTQEKRLSNQLSKAYKDSGINNIGMSRRTLKDDAIANGAKGSHEINSRCGITSYASEDKFQSQMHVIGAYCYKTFGVRYIAQIKPEHIQAFAKELIEREYARNTAQSYCSAIEKFAVVLDKSLPIQGHTRTEEWHNALIDIRREVSAECPAKDTDTRAYSNPDAIIDRLTDPACKLVASLQLNHGLRVADACNLRNVSADGVLISNSKTDKKCRLSSHRRSKHYIDNSTIQLSVNLIMLMTCVLLLMLWVNSGRALTVCATTTRNRG